MRDPARSEDQRGPGLGVDPLHVVDGQQQRAILRLQGEQAEGGRRHEESVRAGAASRGSSEGGVERPALGRGQPVEPIEERAEQVQQPGVGEGELRFHAAAPHHVDGRRGLPGGGDHSVQQGGLADTRLALDADRRADAIGRGDDQSDERIDLGVAAHQHRGTVGQRTCGRAGERGHDGGGPRN